MAVASRSLFLLYPDVSPMTVILLPSAALQERARPRGLLCVLPFWDGFTILIELPRCNVLVVGLCIDALLDSEALEDGAGMEES